MIIRKLSFDENFSLIQHKRFLCQTNYGKDEETQTARNMHTAYFNTYNYIYTWNNNNERLKATKDESVIADL